jgi:MATE family multidrug resistance protein
MEGSLQGDLKWKDRPLRELVRLSWPITLSTLSYSIMTLVDTLILGRLGAAELAGVGLGGVAAFVLLCFPFGVLRGVKTLVSQAVGAGRRDEVRAYLGASLLTAFAVGLAVVLLGQAIAPFVQTIPPLREAGEAAATYLRVRVLGAPLVLVYVALREVRYGQSDARTPMIATLIANGVNVGLAWLFVFGFGWGVAGAAWATVVAHGVEAGVVALATGGLAASVRSMLRRHLSELWKIGLPTGLQFALEVGAFAMLAGMIAAMSEVEMAAHQIALQITHFSFLPAFAVAEAASVLAGQAVGANRDDLVLGVARRGMVATGIYTGACGIVMLVAGALISRGFTSDGAVVAEAASLLIVAAVFQVFDAANIMGRAVLRGTGDVRYAAVVGVVTSWLFTPPLTWALGWVLGLGALGGWIGLCAEIILGAVLLWLRLERKRWHPAAAASRARMREIASAPPPPPLDPREEAEAA